MASVPLLMKKQFWSRPGVTAESNRASAARHGSSSLLAVERHTLHLVGHRLDDLRVIDPRAEDAVAAQAVDVFPAQEIRSKSPGPTIPAPRTVRPR
jgi:hypothetical protein